MNTKAHAAISGFSAWGTLTYLRKRFPHARLPDPILAGLVAALSASLPDVIEPATSPYHRQIFHSIGFAGTLGLSMRKIYEWAPKTRDDEILRDVLLSVGFSYLSHLGADATTPMGLPWFAKLP